MKKRILALLLTLTMLFGSMSIFAVGTGASTTAPEKHLYSLCLQTEHTALWQVRKPNMKR